MAALAWAGDDERAQDLFQQHRWFELRSIPVADRYAAALTKGALALAFNQPAEAERQLKLAIRLAKGGEQINAAREKLVVLYLLHGRLRDSVAQMRFALKRDPSRQDLQAMLDLFGPLSSSPPFTARLPKGGAPLPCEVKPDGVWIKLNANGKPVTWLLDTGANFSTIAESEARLLGVETHGGAGVARDLAGGEVTANTGVIQRIAIGAIEIRNLPVLILPDGQPPWDEWAPGHRGIIGISAILALQTISWTPESMCRAGAESSHHGETPNLAFDHFNPVVRTTLDGKPLDFILDTGNQSGTQLWSRFKAEFPAVVSAPGVTTATTKVTQAGGSNERPITNIPELRLNAGGLAALLKPAQLFSKPVGNDYLHGLLGMDVYSQAREIVIDFRTMIFTAR